jgi:hypothetical protein
MILDKKTKIGELLKEYPFLIEFLPTLSPVYKKLRNPVLRRTLGRTATLEMIAEMGEIELSTLISKIKIEKQKNSHYLQDTKKERQEQLKEIIKDLHNGVDINILKERFAELIKDVSPSEISQMEQSLIDEGMPESEVKRLCDVHVEVFKQSLEEQKIPDTEPGHPIHTYMIENRETEKILKQLSKIFCKLEDSPNKKLFDKHKKNLETVIDRLSQIEFHYLRKENQLFPILEQHNISGPTQVMWGIHDDIRAELKNLKNNISQENIIQIIESIKNVNQMIKDMIYKEEHILFPMSMETLNDEDWIKVKTGEEEIGYSWIKPEEDWAPKTEAIDEMIKETGKLSLETGTLTLDQVNLMLKHLPVDISFVNEISTGKCFNIRLT